jgi:hypothetical protein
MARWEVDLRTEGSFVGTVLPEALSFDITLKEPEIVDFEISLANPVVKRDFITPYASDFMLRRINKELIGGIITQVNLKGEDDAIKVGGKGYLHYLERRHYPFPSYNASDSNTFGADKLFKAVNKDPIQIVTDMLTGMRDAPQSFSLPFTVVANGHIGIKINYRIPPGDTENLLSKITTLSEAYGAGFDFEMTPQKVFKTYVFEKFPSRESRYVFTRDDITDGGIEWTNTGPRGTHVVAQGAGTSVPLSINKHYRGNSAVFRRLDDVADGSDEIRDLNLLASLASGQAAWGSNPQQELTIEVQPENVEVGNFWDAIMPGVYVNVNYDFYPYHKLEALRKITNLHCEVTETGEEIVTLTLERFYDFSDDDGYNDA